MRVIIDTFDKVSSIAVQYIADKINNFKPTLGKPYFVLALSTGNSVKKAYDNLVLLHKSGRLSFKNVVAFVLDEFVGIDRTHENSYHTYMYNNLFSLIDIQPKNVHILDGSAADLTAECHQYEEIMEQYRGIDLCITGVGKDAHLGFNEPGSSLSSTTREKILSANTIQTISSVFKDKGGVPKSALTMGISNIMSCKEVILLINGVQKCEALYHIIECGISHMWPASALQRHPKCVIFCDEESTEKLSSRTIDYFVSLMNRYKELHPKSTEVDMLTDLSDVLLQIK